VSRAHRGVVAGRRRFTAPTSPAAPITITAGGTYSGYYRSTDPLVYAVKVQTTAPVVLDHALIEHVGRGISYGVAQTNLTVTHCKITALDPGTANPVDQLTIGIYQPASLVIEHNLFDLGHGLSFNGEHLTTSPLRIRYNNYRDIGRWDSTGLIQAVGFDKVNAPGALISYNRIRNRYGHSHVEDTIGIVNSDGASGSPITVDHNLLDGAYPFSGDGAGYNGGGIDFADAGGTWQESHHNTIVRCTNNGCMIPAGSDISHHDNTVLATGYADDGTRVSSTSGNGLNLWDNPGYAGSPLRCSEYANRSGLLRWSGTAWQRSDQYTPACDPAGACTGNVSADGVSPTGSGRDPTEADITAAVDAWETARVAAGVVCGPDW